MPATARWPLFRAVPGGRLGRTAGLADPRYGGSASRRSVEHCGWRRVAAAPLSIPRKRTPGAVSLRLLPRRASSRVRSRSTARDVHVRVRAIARREANSDQDRAASSHRDAPYRWGSEGAQPPASLRRGHAKRGHKEYAGLATVEWLKPGWGRPPATADAARPATRGRAARPQDATAQADGRNARREPPERRTVKRAPASFSRRGAAWDGGRSPETDPVEARGAPSGAAARPASCWRACYSNSDAVLERGLEDRAFDPGEFLPDRGVGIGGLGPAGDQAPGPLEFAPGPGDGHDLDRPTQARERVPEPVVRRAPGPERGRGFVAGPA